MLDGEVARRTARTTRFGSLLDSALDRIADAAMFGGLAIFWLGDGAPQMAFISAIALVGSFLTSYVRARAEALGAGSDARAGWIDRPARIVLLCAPEALFGRAFDGMIAALAVVVLAFTSWVTVVQRLRIVYTGFDRD
jgi:CDP-diacylglycerol--glycerol-3-phosphate 3-phosphatidyltransferase